MVSRPAHRDPGSGEPASREPIDREQPGAAPSPQVTAVRHRLGYLLKHAQLALAEHTGPALEPLAINGRELAILTVLGGSERLSQQQAAGRLGVDRTSMVDLIDSLE